METEVDMERLRATALQVVTEAVKDGSHEDLKQSSFRAKVTEAMSLESGTLDPPEYRSLIWKIAKDYVATVEVEDGKTEQAKPKKKRKSSPGLETTTTEATKSSAVKPAGKKAASKKPSKSKKPARSASVVPTSDEEADERPVATKSNSKKGRTTTAKRVESDSETPADIAKPPPTKRRKTSSPGPDEGGPPQASSSSAQVEAKQSRPTDGEKSESEMSVLIDDDPPIRKRKGKRETKAEGEKGKSEKGKKARKQKEPAKELSKDEETLKRLKALMVACGVRKVWSKEFKDVNKPSDQIRRLRKMLADLGMTGRMSMEQAKAIKEKREFERELEDVQEFAQKMENAERRRDQKSAMVEDEIQVDSESDVDVKPKRRTTARQSIMAFLGDEDESD